MMHTKFDGHRTLGCVLDMDIYTCNKFQYYDIMLRVLCCIVLTKALFNFIDPSTILARPQVDVVFDLFLTVG